MKRFTTFILAMIGLITPLMQISAASPTFEDLRTAIAGTEAFKEGESEEAFRLLDQYINASAGDKTRRDYIEAGLIAALQSSKSTAGKQRICTRLHLVGTDKSVEALSGLLNSGDSTLVEAACYALSSNPSDSSKRALRNALPHASGNGLVAIIHLLGELRDDNSTMDLIALGDFSEGSVKEAVFNTLGELANTPATDYLTQELQSKNFQMRRLAGLALAEAAQRLEDSAHPDMAARIYESLLDDQVPAFIRRGAYLGKFRVTGFSDVEGVLKQIRGEDDTLVAAAISLIPMLKGELATLKVVSALSSLNAGISNRVIHALALRGDSAAVPVLLSMLNESDSADAVLQAIGELGDASVVPVLLEQLGKNDSEKSEAIRSALARIEGGSVDALILDAFDKSNETMAEGLLELLAERSSVEAVPLLLELAGKKNGSLVKESLRSLRTCGQVEDLPLAIKLIETHAGSTDLRYVREALASIAQKASRGGISGVEVLGALDRSQPNPVRLELLHVLGMVRDPAALQHLEEVFDDENPDIRHKAYESAIRIAQMSVSRNDEIPQVMTTLELLSKQTDHSKVREQATSLLLK